MQNLESKNIIDVIIERFMEIMSIKPFKPKIDNFLKTEFLRSMSKVEEQLKPSINFVTDEKELTILNNYVFQNLQSQADSVGNQLRQELQRGLLNKETPEQLKKRIKDVFKDKTYLNRMKTVIRTEKMRANNYGALSGARQAKEAGIKLKKFLHITEDGRTSPICRMEDKKYGDKSKAIPLEDDFVVKVDNKTYRAKSPPFHYNCRTILRFVREDEE